MQIKEIGLSWIVVKNIKEAVRYYTEIVGLKLLEFNEQYGWAELQGHCGGPYLGLAQENSKEKIKAGQNAVITLSVEDLDKAKSEMVKKGVVCEGGILEVPGHVKMQTMIDRDGNHFQICQILHEQS
ncbi:MAG: VOC family protein [Verrucomicrobia bacterium]|nr:VOC family protein [Verrucomicrobiota bacterium]MBS0645747.1 VOC family protein [Verrucomicrobiota bacterium]